MLHRLALVTLLALPGGLFAATPVNINQANAATIAKSLDGIGQNRARAIVAWREAHGPFKRADQLSRIKGIGKATLERNRSAILLADAPATSSKPAPRRHPPATKE
ncbi:MAG: competence protein ComEA [Rhodanobacter sp.]|nr:MAG: competence protein ComEA [Rhodanobacter sp.]